ncbi:hypothetical protein [Mycobacteroides abscessus]|uniref:hypothetical protein n=1 Tax=Mycobacteroides abscessus TaxID=36809 RepID=UPI0005E7BAED|nr:hypothetical protein [Mycobacteroides abscessus]CPW71641.1 Uncharacterised protein [Mycobacteroides abscessus]SKF62123.1 Uncharacterised protein [Mycobacteroides abscessus subsp. bolletii]SKH91608.1 Uncharacterised protein [Mycobacteroides abscessus subsp. bolletii]
MGDTITIADRDAFPKKVESIKQAVANLRTFGPKLEAIVAKAREEARSLTTNGQPAPIYPALLDGLGAWHTAASSATAAVCDSAEGCTKTITDKFTQITGTDAAAAQNIVKA